MAFQDVNNRNSADRTQKATDLKVGESILGYVTDIRDGKIEGSKNLFLKGKDGSSVLFFTAGNLKYMIKDNKIAVGSYTRITRLEDKSVKGKKSSQFKVEQDPSDTLASSAEQAFMDATEPAAAPSAPTRPYAGIMKSAQPKKV